MPVPATPGMLGCVRAWITSAPARRTLLAALLASAAKEPGSLGGGRWRPAPR